MTKKFKIFTIAAVLIIGALMVWHVQVVCAANTALVTRAIERYSEPVITANSEEEEAPTMKTRPRKKAPQRASQSRLSRPTN